MYTKKKMLALVVLMSLIAVSSARLIIGGNPTTWEPSEDCKVSLLVSASGENKLLEIAPSQLCGQSSECELVYSYMKKELSDPAQFCKSIKMC